MMLKHARVYPSFFAFILMLGLVLGACTPPPNQSAAPFGIQAKKEPPGQHKPKAKNRLPVATVYTVGDLDPEDPVPANPGDFRIQAYPVATACYDCRWSALSLNASYVAASFAPGSDSFGLDHPDMNNPDFPHHGYHFAVTPSYGTTASGKKIATRLRVFMRVSAMRRNNIISFGRRIATGYIDFVSTDGIHYSFEDYNSLDAVISASYGEVTDPNPANYCGSRSSNSGTANLPKTIESASLTLDEANEQAQIQVVMSASARAQIYNSACSSYSLIYGTNTAVFNVTADLKFEDDPADPQPSPTPTATPTANPDPEPTPSPEPTPGGGNGGNNGSGGNAGNNGGGNGGGEPCTCGADGFSVLNNEECPPTCSGMNPKINKKPVEVRNKEYCRTGTTRGFQEDPDFKLLNVYDFDKAPNKPDLVFVFTKGTPKDHRGQAINNFIAELGASSQAKAFSRQNGQSRNFSDNLVLRSFCRGGNCLEKMSFDNVSGYYPLNDPGFPDFNGSYEPLKTIKEDLKKEHPQYAQKNSLKMEIFAVSVDMDKSGINNNVVERIASSPTQSTGLRITLDTSQDNPGDPITPHSSLSVKIGRKGNGDFYVDCGPLGDNV